MIGSNVKKQKNMAVSTDTTVKHWPRKLMVESILWERNILGIYNKDEEIILAYHTFRFNPKYKNSSVKKHLRALLQRTYFWLIFREDEDAILAVFQLI